MAKTEMKKREREKKKKREKLDIKNERNNMMNTKIEKSNVNILNLSFK